MQFSVTKGRASERHDELRNTIRAFEAGIKVVYEHQRGLSDPDSNIALLLAMLDVQHSQLRHEREVLSRILHVLDGNSELDELLTLVAYLEELGKPVRRVFAGQE